MVRKTSKGYKSNENNYAEALQAKGLLLP
jgi:hypothetical protein